MQRFFAALASSIVCAAAHASDFRFCEMDGAVESATAYDGSRRTFDVVVHVASSRKEKGERGKLGYTDCSEYVGERVDVRLQIPPRYGEPARGDLGAALSSQGLPWTQLPTFS